MKSLFYLIASVIISFLIFAIEVIGFFCLFTKVFWFILFFIGISTNATIIYFFLNKDE